MKGTKTIICALLFLILLPTAALAMTQEEWNLSCRLKTKCTTTVYVIGTQNDVQEIIPANTYVKVYDTTGNDLKKIRFMVDGQIRNGKVPASNLVTVTSSYRGSSGYAEDVHELDPNHDEILKQNQVITVAESLLQFGTTDYSDLTFELPNSPSAEKAKATKGRSESGTEEKTEMEPSVKQVSTQSSKQENTNNSTKKSTATQGNVQVTLEQVGTRTSKVHYNGKTHEVPTAELNFGGDVPEGKETGVIYAPNTGKASLRSKASSSGTVLRKCKAGTVVTVLDWGNNYCKINYKGSVGYVLTDCLLFPSADQEVLGTAQLSYNGRTTGSTTINVRNAADGDSAKVAEWATGTEVEVFSLQDGWYEIEHDGIHGFVMERYLTMHD